MQNLTVMKVHGVRVLTTRQLARMYGTEPEIINNNFLRNKTKYIPEKHYIAVEGEEIRQLKTSHQFDGELKRVSRAYFWTEKGALLHAKSLNTDKAWEVYDYLVDFYFRAKEKPDPVKTAVVPVTMKEEPLKDEIPIKSGYQDEISILKILLKVAQERGLQVKTKNLIISKSYLNKDRIAIRHGMSLEAVNYELAFDLFMR